MHKVKEISSDVQIKLFRNERKCTRNWKPGLPAVPCLHIHIHWHTGTLLALRQDNSSVRIHSREDIEIMLWPYVFVRKNCIIYDENSNKVEGYKLNKRTKQHSRYVDNHTLLQVTRMMMIVCLLCIIYFLYMHILWLGKEEENERQTDRQTDRQTNGDRERQRQRESETDREKAT